MPGTNFLSDVTSTLKAELIDDSGLIRTATCTGTPPTTANRFAHGALITQTDSGTGNAATYQNVGSSAVPSWELMESGTVTASNVLITNGSSFNDNSGNELLKFAVTASAVNEVSVTNAATAGTPSLTSTGGDTNIGLLLSGKGTGAVGLGQATSTGVLLVASQPLLDANANELVKFGATASAVNEVTLTNAATAGTPAVSATGDDTNINLGLAGKGTGIVALGQAGTGTCSSNAVTISTQRGVITTESLTTAAGATQNIALTNTKITSSSVMLVTLGAGTNTTGTPLLFVTPASGSATITILNAHASDALNGTLKIHFMV